MSSNVFEDTSNPSEEASIDLNLYEWVPVSLAAIREDVSAKTIYERASDNYYRSRKQGAKQLEVLLPKIGENTTNSSNVGVKPKTYVTPPSKEVNSFSPVGEEFQTSVLTLLKQQALLSEKLLTQGEKLQNVTLELEQKRAELTIANNERANYNTSLQRAKSDREELEDARRKIRDLEALLEAEKKKSLIDKLLGR